MRSCPALLHDVPVRGALHDFLLGRGEQPLDTSGDAIQDSLKKSRNRRDWRIFLLLGRLQRLDFTSLHARLIRATGQRLHSLMVSNPCQLIRVEIRFEFPRHFNFPFANAGDYVPLGSSFLTLQLYKNDERSIINLDCSAYMA